MYALRKSLWYIKWLLGIFIIQAAYFHYIWLPIRLPDTRAVQDFENRLLTGVYSRLEENIDRNVDENMHELAFLNQVAYRYCVANTKRPQAENDIEKRYYANVVKRKCFVSSVNNY